MTFPRHLEVELNLVLARRMLHASSGAARSILFHQRIVGALITASIIGAIWHWPLWLRLAFLAVTLAHAVFLLLVADTVKRKIDAIEHDFFNGGQSNGRTD